MKADGVMGVRSGRHDSRLAEGMHRKASPSGTMGGSWWASLHGRLVVVVLAIFIPLFGLVILQELNKRTDALVAARNDVVRTAQAAERQLAGNIYWMQQVLRAMAADPALLDKDRAACSAALAKQLEGDDRNAAFLVIDGDGKLICHSDPTAPATDYSDRDYFRRVIETRHLVVGVPVTGRTTGRPVLPVAWPLLVAGDKVQRVLVSGLDLAWVGSTIAQSAANPAVIEMFDRNGRVLFRHPERHTGQVTSNASLVQALRERRSGEGFESKDLAGEAQLSALEYSREHAPGTLTIHASVPRGVVTAVIDRTLIANLSALALAALLALMAANLLAERLVRRPALGLVRAAEKLGAGDLSSRVMESEFSGELHQLAVAFNAAAGALSANREALQAGEVELRAALNASERALARAEALLEAAPDSILITDREGRIAIVNAVVESTFGYTRAELLGKPITTMIPQWLPAALAAEHASRQEQESSRARAISAGHDLAAQRKDGSEFAVDVSLSPLTTQDGTLIISTVRDVTERREAERRIRSQLEHLHLLDQITRATGERDDLMSILQVVVRSLEDSLPVDFACVCLREEAASALRVTCVGVKNQAVARELTTAAGAAIEIDQNGLGRCMRGALVYEPDIGCTRFPFAQSLARGGLRAVVMAPLRSESQVLGVLVAGRCVAESFVSVECEFLRQLSEHVALAAHQAHLYESLRQAYEDLRQTQQAAMQQERLRALGQLSSGIAHDINNTLSPVSLYADLLLEKEEGLSTQARDYLRTMRRAVDDVTETVGRMREFYRARGVQRDLAPLDLNELAHQVLDLTRARWSDIPQQHGVSIEARTELASGLPRIMGVESEIREALVNLVLNAVDAMAKGGALTLRTRAIAGDGDASAQFVVMEVADEGMGMDEETRKRCLEPFFSTKGERGTGLGLAMVFGMVQRHSAELEIDSAPGAGTTVRLAFPTSGVTAGAPQPPAVSAEALPRLRLLLVDDDPVLVESLRRTLEAHGHVIETADGGEAGIAAFRGSLARAEPFDAVITDLGMPHVDGRRVAAAVKQASSRTPVIMLTGWGRRLVAEGDIPPHVDRVLAKPARLHELLGTLAQLCGSAANQDGEAS